MTFDRHSKKPGARSLRSRPPHLGHAAGLIGWQIYLAAADGSMVAAEARGQEPSLT